MLTPLNILAAKVLPKLAEQEQKNVMSWLETYHGWVADELYLEYNLTKGKMSNFGFAVAGLATHWVEFNTDGSLAGIWQSSPSLPDGMCAVGVMGGVPRIYYKDGKVYRQVSPGAAEGAEWLVKPTKDNASHAERLLESIPEVKAWGIDKKLAKWILALSQPPEILISHIKAKQSNKSIKMYIGVRQES